MKISEARFRTTAAPGDILLFRGKTLGNKLQRLFTRGKYDHVAVLFRDKKGRLAMLESMNGLGVTFTYWSEFSFSNCKSHYEKIVYRHLCCQRAREMMNRLVRFVMVRHNLTIREF